MRLVPRLLHFAQIRHEFFVGVVTLHCQAQITCMIVPEQLHVGAEHVLKCLSYKKRFCNVPYKVLQ